MQCELCEEWKHAKCDKVSDELYKALGDNTEETRLHWFCKDCNSKAVKGIKLVICVEKRTTELETGLETLRKQFAAKTKELEDSLTCMRTELSQTVTIQTINDLKKNNQEEIKAIVEVSMDKKIADNGGNVDANTAQLIKDTVNMQIEANKSEIPTEAAEAPGDWSEVVRKEIKKVVHQSVETGKRERNVILYRAVEKKEDPKKNDEELIKALLAQCKVEKGMDAVQDFRRIGAKVDGRERPILLSFKELDQKIVLFKNLRNLKGAADNISGISVSHDMSQEERAVTKNLVAEAKQKELADPANRYRVRGPPGAQRIVRLDPQGRPG